MIDSLDDKEIIELFNQDTDKSNLAFKHIVNQFGGTLFFNQIRGIPRCHELTK